MELTTSDADVAALEELILVDDWKVFERLSVDARMTLKNNPVDAPTLRRMLGINGLNSVCLLTEQVLNVKRESNQLRSCLRTAILGTRGPDTTIDGVIADLDVTLLRSGRLWLVVQLDFRCPPDEALWESRPSSTAPIDYRVEAATQEGLSQLVNAARNRLRKSLLEDASDDLDILKICAKETGAVTRVLGTN